MHRENPETRILENIDTDRLYQQVIAQIKEREIQLEYFKNLYGAEAVQRDIKYVDTMERLFNSEATSEQKEAQKFATIFEWIFNQHAEMSDWLGPNAMLIKSSRFDDIKNGIDSIAEFQETSTAASYLGLAIDVTTTTDLAKKFETIKQEIARGDLGKITYFVSEHTNMRGELSNIPKVVVGADRKTVQSLADMYGEKDNAALARHFIQFQILEEIGFELDAFEKYANQTNHLDLESVYRKTGKMIKNILSAKHSTIKDTKERDAVFSAIKLQLINFKS